MPRYRVIEATIAAEPGADGVATEFRLLAAGENRFNDGDTILFDEVAAASVMMRYRARGIDLMADYEHQSLVRPPVIAPASAKRWEPEVRDGALYAASIQWTERARSMLAAGEYRYYSIACLVDAESNRCAEVINFALTNLPAAIGIGALAAAARQYETVEDDNMKRVLDALGLAADADEAAGVAKASKLVDLEREVLQLTKAKTLSEAHGALQAHAQSHEQVVALTSRVRQLEADKREQEFDALVKAGQSANQITPAMAAGEWLTQLRAREDGVMQLKSFLAAAPKFAAAQGEIREASRPSPADEITAIDREIAAQLIGPDPKALEKHFTELRALRRAALERQG